MVANLDVFQLRPGIDDLLRKLRKLGLKLGLVTNRPEPPDIGDLFDYCGPRPLTAVAEALGVAPTECIMIGDRLDTDIAPAKALGMATIRFCTGRHRRQKARSAAERPDAEATDVAELEAAIGACG